MSRNLIKVDNYVENDIIDFERLRNYLILRETNPVVSIPLVCNGKSEEEINDLCSKANIEYKDGDFYKDGELITSDMKLHVIINSLIHSAKTYSLSREDVQYMFDLIKHIIENVLDLFKETKKDLTVEDLMMSLYGEEGTKKK